MTRSIIERMTKDGDYNLEDNIAKMKKRLLKLRGEKEGRQVKIQSTEIQLEKAKIELSCLSGKIEELEFCANFLDDAAKEWGFRGLAIETPSATSTDPKAKVKLIDKGQEIEERVAKNLCTRFNRETKKYCSRKTTTKEQKKAKLCKACLKEFS